MKFYGAGKDPDRVYVSAPYDFERSNAFERYVNQIWSSLKVDRRTDGKRLYLGDCVRLRNHIQNTPSDAATKGNVKDYPAIVALGGTIHSLLMLRPWLVFSRPERTIPIIQQDPLNELLEGQRRAYWEMENESYGCEELDEYDDGGLRTTI